MKREEREKKAKQRERKTKARESHKKWVEEKNTEAARRRKQLDQEKELKVLEAQTVRVILYS